MTRALDALNGGVRGHAYLDALSWEALGEYGQEVLDASPYVVGFGGYRLTCLRPIEPVKQRL
jgi:hypothetical protein